MSFTTLAFAIFLLIVFSVYWLLLGGSYRKQNIWLLMAGYVFYGWWDWRFLGLIFAVTAVSWACALPKNNRKVFAILAVTFNLGVLCVFKYLNFFGDGLRRLIEAFGIAIDWFTIDILLPVGISFYTFQAIGYSVDVYRKRIDPEKNFLTYALYIAFFPQLVAGPIERANSLLPQFKKARVWSYGESVLGLRQILWGLFKKCVVADGVIFWVNNGFDSHVYESSLYGNFQCWIAVVGFALQIYCDFSGYCDIARGTARLFGIRLMDNFLYPFFSRNAVELWHRWHRSLMQWFTEYVYIPLGGSRTGKVYFNVIVVFLLSGLWHGADLSFILWGLLCGIWYIVARILKAKKYSPERDDVAERADLPKIVLTFSLFALVFIFFRAPDVEMGLKMAYNVIFPGIPIFMGMILIGWLLSKTHISLKVLMILCSCALILLGFVFPVETVRYVMGFAGFIFGAIVMAVEWKGRRFSFALESMSVSKPIRYMVYMAIYMAILTSVIDIGESEFIYFKF